MQRRINSIFEFCHPLDLCSTICHVSKDWNLLIVNQKALWSQHCDTLWRGKSYILPQATDIQASDPMNAYKISCIDQKRNVITFDELTSIKWHFTFKGWDPRFITGNNDEETIIFGEFHKNGTLTHAPIQFGHRFRWKFIEYFTKRSWLNEYLEMSDEEEEEESTDKENVCEYGYLEKRIDGRQSRWIQVNNFPPLVVARNPENWGFILQNDHVTFTSY